MVHTHRGSISLPTDVDDKTLITEARLEKYGPLWVTLVGFGHHPRLAGQPPTFESRRHKRAIMAEHGDDVEKLLQDLRQRQQGNPRLVVSRPSSAVVREESP